MINVFAKYEGSFVNINDYVERISPVPYIARNRDYTLRIETVKLTIAKTVDSICLFTEGQEFSFYEGSTFLFHALLIKRKYSNRNMVYDIVVEGTIGQLAGYKVDYDNLYSLISAGSPAWYEFVASDYNGNSSVGVLHLLKNIFAKGGFTLDISNVANEVANPDYVYSGGSRELLYKELFFDTDMIWCVNQSVAVHHSKIDDTSPGSADYWKNKITLFDLASEIISCLGLVLTSSAPFTYAIDVENETSYNVADDDTFDLDEDKIKASVDLTNFGATVNYATNRIQYRSLTPTNLEHVGIYGEGSGIEVYKNFSILFSSAPVTSSHEVGSAEPFISTDRIVDGNINSAYRKVRAKISNYTENTVLTNAELTEKSVIENFIDVDSNSNIIQEAYSE